MDETWAVRFIRVLTHLISLKDHRYSFISFIPLYVGLQVKRLLILCWNSILEMIFLPPVMSLTLNLLCLDYSVIKKQIVLVQCSYPPVHLKCPKRKGSSLDAADCPF